MKKLGSSFLLRAACVLTLVSLALIAWGILDPMPVPVIFAMSLGQGIGTVAVVLFGIVVLRDLRPRLEAPAVGVAGSERPAPPEPAADEADAGADEEQVGEPSAGEPDARDSEAPKS